VFLLPPGAAVPSNWTAERVLFNACGGAEREKIPLMLIALLHRIARRPAALDAASTLRGAVCPPGVFADSAARGWRRWLARAPLDTGAIAADHLAGVKGEFCALLDDVVTRDSYFLMVKVGSARSLRELWHLRCELYSAIACHHSQGEAERRLGSLNRHFPLRPAPTRSGFAPLSPR
jgi:hypothetical protein